MLPSADPHPSLRDTFSSRERQAGAAFVYLCATFFLYYGEITYIMLN